MGAAQQPPVAQHSDALQDDACSESTQPDRSDEVVMLPPPPAEDATPDGVNLRFGLEREVNVVLVAGVQEVVRNEAPARCRGPEREGEVNVVFVEEEGVQVVRNEALARVQSPPAAAAAATRSDCLDCPAEDGDGRRSRRCVPDLRRGVQAAALACDGTGKKKKKRDFGVSFFTQGINSLLKRKVGLALNYLNSVKHVPGTAVPSGVPDSVSKKVAEHFVPGEKAEVSWTRLSCVAIFGGVVRAIEAVLQARESARLLALKERVNGYFKTPQLFLSLPSPGPSQSRVRVRTRTVRRNKAGYAIDDCTEAIKKDPKSLAHRLERSKAYIEVGLHDEAIADADSVIAAPSHSPPAAAAGVAAPATVGGGLHQRCLLCEAYTSRAESFFLKGEFDAAVRDYRLAAALDHENSGALFNQLRSSAYKSLIDNNLKLAVRYFDLLICLREDDSESFLTRAAVHQELGELRLSDEDYSTGCSLFCAHCDIEHLGIMSIERDGAYNAKKVRAAVRRTLHPQNSLGYLSSSNPRQYWCSSGLCAVRDATIVLHICSRDRESLVSLAEAYCQHRWFKLALATCNSALRLKGADALALCIRALALVGCEKRQEAERDVRSVLRIAPDEAKGLLMRAGRLCRVSSWQSILDRCNVHSIEEYQRRARRLLAVRENDRLFPDGWLELFRVLELACPPQQSGDPQLLLERARCAEIVFRRYLSMTWDEKLLSRLGVDADAVQSLQEELSPSNIVRMFLTSFKNDPSMKDAPENALRDKAVQWTRRGLYNLAMHAFSMLLSKTPSSAPLDVDCLLARAKCYVKGKTQNLKLAINDCTVVIKAAPRCMAAFLLRGDALAELKEEDAAFQDYHTHHRLWLKTEGGRSLSVHVQRGEVRRKKKKWRLAIEHYNRALRLDRTDCRAILGRAVATCELRDYVAAREDCTSLLCRRSDDSEAHFLLADICWMTKKRDEARVHYTQAFQFDPGEVRHLEEVFLARATTSQVHHALDSLTSRTFSTFLCREGNFVHVDGLIFVGSHVQASVLEACGILLDCISQNHLPALACQAGISTERGKFERAIEEWTQLIKLATGHPKAFSAVLAYRGDAHALKGDHSSASADYNKAAQYLRKTLPAFMDGRSHSLLSSSLRMKWSEGAITPRALMSAVDWLEQGDRYRQYREYSLAVDSFTKSLELSRGRNSVRMMKRGLCYLQLKRYQKASRDLTVALRGQSRHWLSLSDRFQCLHARGEATFFAGAGYDYGMTDFKGALGLVRHASAGTSWRLECFVSMGLSLLVRGRWGEALGKTEQALALIRRVQTYTVQVEQQLLWGHAFALMRTGQGHVAARLLTDPPDGLSLVVSGRWVEESLRCFPQLVAAAQDLLRFMDPAHRVSVKLVGLVRQFYSLSPSAARRVGLGECDRVSGAPFSLPFHDGLELVRCTDSFSLATAIDRLTSAAADASFEEDEVRIRRLRSGIGQLCARLGFGLRLHSDRQRPPLCAAQQKAWSFLTSKSVLGQLHSSQLSLMFDHSRDLCYCEECLHRRGEEDASMKVLGGESHAVPRGCTEFGLSVSDIACGRGCLTRWHFAFHGTTVMNGVSILRDGAELLMPGDEGPTNCVRVRPGHITTQSWAKGLFFSKSVVYAEKYSRAGRNEFGTFKLLLGIRIKPSKYEVRGATTPDARRGVRIDPLFPNSELEWIVRKRACVYVVSVLVKELVAGKSLLREAREDGDG